MNPTFSSGKFQGLCPMKAHEFTPSSIRLSAARALVLFLVAVSSMTGRLLAQEYQSDPIDDKVAIRNRVVAQQCVKDPAVFAANTDKFLDYFNNYHFPAMTRTEPEKMADLGKLRDEIFRLYLWKSPNPELQRALTDAALARMGKIVQGPHHPAVRYNAIIVIGMLDEKYSPDGKQAPTPLPKATKGLTNIVASAASSTLPTSVILGAVIGLERHAQYSKNVPPDAIAGMSASLIKLINHDQPIQEMDRSSYAWMRLRAASALSKLGTAGPNNSIHNALIKLITSSKSLDDRCEAALLLDRLEYKNVKLDEAGTATPLFALAHDVAVAEDKRAGDFQSNYGSAPTTRAFPRGGPESFAPGGTTGEQETYPRRQVLARLTGVRNALNKVKASLPTDTQKKVDEVIKAIDPGKNAVASRDVVELKLAETIRTMAVAVNKALPAPEKAAGDKKAAETL